MKTSPRRNGEGSCLTVAMVDPFVPPVGWPARSVWQRDCTACGACCSAPDIHALGKPLGVPCLHLGEQTLQGGCLCAIYPARPAVCRSYAPDWICGEVAPLPTLAQRVRRFLEIYGLEGELPPLGPPSEKR